ncbi:MAG: hypothetical protein HOM11_16885 [Methylococcales bacterium]|jgi:pimeloyl-ACP methyl ester carboxylesterase|nr:hypothetical protein [Methylococcales bacterium]MBT7443007.1 hypothetical protein [Methylococcales bacterium]
MATKNAPRIMFVHGIWMVGLEMSYLKRHVAKQGYETTGFVYRTITKSIPVNAEKLYQRLQSDGVETILIAHSLGGLLVAEMVRLHPDVLSLVKGVMSLGSPLKGSHVAKHIADRWWLRWGLGKSRQALVQGTASWEHSTPWLSLAGTTQVGVGRYLGAIKERGDGAVAVRETQLDGVEFAGEFPVSHTMMLFSKEVLDVVLGFLGKFDKPK